jgi:hypothetical protein
MGTARVDARSRAGSGGMLAALAALLCCASCALIAHGGLDHRPGVAGDAVATHECAGRGAVTTTLAVLEVMLGYGLLELPLLPESGAGAPGAPAAQCAWSRRAARHEARR